MGAGKLGRALLSFDGFPQYGLNILAAFDTDPAAANTRVGDKMVLPLEKLPDLCRRTKVRIGIITVPGEHAQQVCDLLIQSGILAIWNFAYVHLEVPPGILVQNENMAVSLAILSNHLKERSAQNKVKRMDHFMETKMNFEIVENVETFEKMLARVREAQKIYASYTQEQVDKIFRAAAMAANLQRIPLAKMAVEETGMGVVEDKVIKNHYAAE